MHLIALPLIGLFAFLWYQAYKHYKRVKAIGESQEKTQDLKAQQELKDINTSNAELSAQLKEEENE